MVLQDAARLAEQEAARERAMIDEVVQRIMLEDAAENAGKRQRQQETKDFIEMFLKQQDELRRKELEAAAAEDRKIAGARGRHGDTRLGFVARRSVAIGCYLGYRELAGRY
jgi:hypothetical protein